MSFFKQFPQIDYDIQQNGEISKIYDIYRHVDVVNKKTDDFTSYTFYEIKDGDRPDIISQKLYGTPDYYWTFFIINDFLQHGYNYFYKSYQTFMRGLQLEYEGRGALVVLPNYDTSFNILGGIDISNDIIKVVRGTSEADPISWSSFNLQLIVDNVTDESIFFDDSSTDRYSLAFKDSATLEQKIEWLKEFNEAQRELKGSTYSDLDESTLSSFEFTAERRYEELITAPYSYYATIDVTDEVSIGDKINAYDAARSGYGDLNQFTTYYQHEEDENELSRKLKVVRPQEIEQFTEQYKTLINS